MAKKAQASGKANARVAKAKPKAVAKKPVKAAALAKAPAAAKAAKAKPQAKPSGKTALTPKKPVEVAASLGKKPTAAAAPKKGASEPALLETKKTEAPAPKPAPKTKAERAIQAAETAEKIKIDKNMTEEQAKWADMYNKYRDAQSSNYDMKATFKAATPIQHKVLGWGWIVSNENDRLEVLFKDGKRMLISNYKG